MINEEKLTSELKEIFNLYSVDNALNTPDFLLAEYVVNVLKAYGQTHSTTQEWLKHGDEDIGEPTTAVEAFIKSVDIGEPPVTDVYALVDSKGNEMPEQEPGEGFKWELEHTVCDQGHYGSSSWKKVVVDLPKYSMLLGSTGRHSESWIIYEQTRGYIDGAVRHLDAGSKILEDEARMILNTMNESPKNFGLF